MSESVDPGDANGHTLARATAGMAAGTVASRVLGVVRASMQLAVVGTFLAGDAWDVANTLPNIIYLLLAGGVLNAVLVPQITRAASHSDGGREYVDRLLTIAITGIAIVAVVFTLAAGLLVRLYSSPTWNPDVRSLSTAFALICLPQIFFYGLYTLLGQVLNARNQFAAYMWAPVVANIVAIVGMAYFLLKYPHQAGAATWTSPMVWVLAGSATAGVAAQALVLIVPLWRSGFRFTPRWGFRGVGLRTASTVALWTFAVSAVSAAGFIITSKVLTYAGQAGSVAGLQVPGKISYTSAFLIFMLPHSLVTVSLVTALFTRMSRAAGAGDLGEVRADVDRGIRLTAVATVPATVGAFVLGFAATATIYLGSSAASTRGIATVMMAMMLGLVPFSVFYLIQRVFYAFEDAKTPFRLQIVVTVVATIANVASLLLPLRWIAVGVGAGQALSNLAGMVVGLVLVRRRLEGLPLGAVTRTYTRLGVASVVAGAASVIVELGLGQVVHGRLYSPVALAGGGLVFAVIYVVAARRLRVREIDDLVGPVMERVRQVLPRGLGASRMRAQTRPPYETEGARVQGVGPGTILGGRYSLRRRLTQGRDLERWSALDTTLERDVALTVVDADHPNRAGILDAARRAAGVEDTRLVRILDVGTQDGNSYFVEEAMSGAESLAAILLRGALPAEEARRIVGEVASGLETARQRGLHHLRLNPHWVLRAADGAIKVSGVAVAAAIDGPDEREPDPAAASRRDAIGVVALAYAALTGRWPLGEQVSGIEPAPRVVGGVAAPSEIAAGVPGDLDALCRMTLNEDTGPLTPGDFASQIAPWSRGPVYRDEVEATVVLHRSQPSSGGADGVVPEADQWADDKAVAAGAAGAATSKAVETAVAGAGAAAAVIGGKVGSFARAAADKAAAARARADTDLDGERMTLGEALSTFSDDAEPPLPMLPASTAQAPTRDQSKIVVMIVAAFVALSLLVAYCGARSLGADISLPSTTPRRTVTVNAPAVTVPAPPATAGVPAGGQPIAILSATGFDPQGDGNEKNTQAPRVYDGNPATAWTSEGYNSANFGGLGKKGVGVRLDLGQPTSVNHVTIDLGAGPVDVTVYAATKDSLDGATVLGSATAASGRIQLNAASAMPQAQYVIVWFTKLAPDGGRFRATISEIALS